MRRLALSAAGLLAALALGEGLARLLHTPPPVRRVFDPFAWRISRPLLHDRFVNARGEEVEIRFDELGLRGSRLDAPPPGALKLVFLGGSAVENYAWNDADTFPVIAGAELQRRLGRPVRVWNGGVSAAPSATTLARVQHQVLDLRPALVLTMDGVNDLLGGFHPGFRADFRHLPRPPEAGARPRSFLMSWLRSLRPPARPPRRPARERRVSDYRRFPARLAFERNQRSLVAIARAHGVPLLLLTQPTTWSDTPDDTDRRRYYLTESLIDLGVDPPDIPSLAAGMRAFNATTLEVAAAMQAPAFDLAARMPRGPELFLDECHLTPEGNRRVAALLVPALEALLRAAP